ncbi:molecular chaperone GrpE [Candidatus Nitrososphaera gargensis Ga9.2]|uniref:Protein GrpE n=1 Tax=Nitrososphaera gargensis (strain Ga9.2) TaxID=1237085 RepID=K0IM33_NITGG|nr:nucleotide exchange factor GrpE [Candidatus Nitrososphaera gargensis]AFU59952.1 molecular chaperone GrpE [Candidatus Nitrososphaera gargensis Ga9.2]
MEKDETLEQQQPHDDEKPVEQDLEALRSELQSVKEELRKAKESSDDSLNKLKYLIADFDNYRKQMEKQAATKVETAKAELLLKFLNIRDDYLRALSVAKQAKTETVVIEGLEGILKNIDSLLASEGVREIETVGTPFDPNVHDAIAYSARDDIEENTVTAEIRKGYMLNSKVLRPSLVEIAKKIVKNSVSDTTKEDTGDIT